MLLEIFLMGLIAALGLLFLLFKIGTPRKILAFDWQIDIALTALLCVVMAGTFTGIMIGLIAGAIISVVLFFMKLKVGADRLTWRGWKKEEA